MKSIPVLTLWLVLQVSCTAQQQQQRFDILTYTPPKGWTEERNNDQVIFSKDGGEKGFCVITLYKSIVASADTKGNFDMAWESLVANTLIVDKPVMQLPVTDNGWVTEVGSSVFEKGNVKGTSILMSSTKNDKLVNILILVNGDEYISAMQTFLESVNMSGSADEQETGNTGKVNQPTSVTTRVSTPQHEVWMSYKYNVLKKRYAAAFFLKYANGDCLDYVPGEGVLGFSKTTDNKSDRHWGIATDKGKEIHITYPGYVRKLGKLSDSKMSYPPGDKVTFYFRCVPVDGLKLDGEWCSGGAYSDPNWYKDPNFKQGTIKFNKEGKFENNGGLYSSKEGAAGFVFRDKGRGTYYIKDFTLVLTYSDGQVFTSALTGLKDVNPQQNNEILYFREVPFYKNLNGKK